MKLIRSFTAYTVVFIAVVVILFVILMIALLVYRRKSKQLIVEEEAPSERRIGSVEAMVDVEDIVNDMIIEKGRKRFVAVLRCTGGDFLRLDPSEQERVQYQYINFWLAQNDRICYRQYGEDIDLSGTVDMYVKARDGLEADLFNYVEDRKALKKRFDACEDGPDRLEIAGALRSLDRNIKAYRWRLIHLDDQIEHIGKISGPAAGRQRMIQTYVVSWTPDAGITGPQLTDEEVFEKAQTELDKLCRDKARLLSDAGAVAQRCRTEELVDMCRCFYRPLSGNRFGTEVLTETSFFDDIVTAESVESRNRRINEQAARAYMTENAG